MSTLPSSSSSTTSSSASRGTLDTGDSRDLDDGARVRRDLAPEEHKSSLLRRRRLVRNAFLGLSDSLLKMQNMATSAFSNVFVIPRKRHQLFSRGGDVQSGSILLAVVTPPRRQKRKVPGSRLALPLGPAAQRGPQIRLFDGRLNLRALELPQFLMRAIITIACRGPGAPAGRSRT